MPHMILRDWAGFSVFCVRQKSHISHTPRPFQRVWTVSLGWPQAPAGKRLNGGGPFPLGPVERTSSSPNPCPHHTHNP